MKRNRVVVIMAGGSGERFWPVSRMNHPKQLLNLSDPDKSLLAEAVERVSCLVPKENIFVATSRLLQPVIQNAGLEIPNENIIGEPCKRNTAGCLAFAAAIVLARFNCTAEQITMAVVTADHRIPQKEIFAASLQSAFAVAEQNNALVTMGIRPLRPDTGFGYIEVDSAATPAVGSEKGYEAFPVVRFREKPDLKTAEMYLATGNYLWNSGMFIWTLETFLKEFENAMPVFSDAVRDICSSFVAGEMEKIDDCFAALPDISIDFALMEKARSVYVLPAEFAWDDLGSWDAVERTLPADENGNVNIGKPIVIDCKDCVVFNAAAERMAVATIGCEDLVVVVTGDAVLVAPKNRVQEVKKVIAEIKQRGGNQF